MTKENDIKDELLRQMEMDSGGSTDTNEDSTKKFLGHYSAQLKRLKWFTIISWIITILYWLGIHNLKVFLSDKHPYEYLLTKGEFLLYDYADMGMRVLIVIAVLISVLMYYKSRTLTMLKISARLAGIEEQLKKMSRKE